MTRSSLPKRGLRVFSILLVLSMGCAHTSGTSRDTAPPSATGPRLDLGVRLSDGRWLELADLRGKPVLLFVFATFDAVSQASLTPLRPFVPQHPGIIVVGIAAQPRAMQLVEAWAYALDPPFGSLGKIEIVPTFILYGAHGYEIDRATGLLTEGDLARLVEPVSDDAN